MFLIMLFVIIVLFLDLFFWFIFSIIIILIQRLINDRSGDIVLAIFSVLCTKDWFV